MTTKIYEFDVMRTGIFNDINIKESDLKELAEAYNVSVNKAPIVIGHPRDNNPAYGLIDSLKVVGNKLKATTKNISDDLVKAIKEKKFNEVSLSIYERNAQSNPTKGRLNLRHCGVFGAKRVAVSNLDPLHMSFSELPEIKDGDTFETKIDFNFEENVPMKEQVKNWVKELFNTEIKQVISTEATKTKVIEMTEKEQVAKLQLDLDKANAKVAKVEAENETLTISFSEQKQKRFEADNLTFCEDAVKDNKLAPALKTSMLNILNKCSTETMNFGEKNSSLVDEVKAFINTQSKILDFTEKSRNKDGFVSQEDKDITVERIQALATKESIDFVEAATKLGATA